MTEPDPREGICLNCRKEIYPLVLSSEGWVYCHTATRNSECQPVRVATLACNDVLAIEGSEGITCLLRDGHEGMHRSNTAYWDDICDDSQHRHRGPWEHVRGSDSLNICMSCGVVHGK